jgi:hypothetical protein
VSEEKIMQTKTLITFQTILFSIFASLALAINLSAQIRGASLNGTVTDPSGASVPNAKVDLLSPSTGSSRQVVTGSSGVYSVTLLPIGTYTVTISAKGFKMFRATGVVLSVGEVRTLDAQLQLGATTEVVEVHASVAALQTSNAEIANVIQPQAVENIPLNGRDYSSLEWLSPGAVNIGAGEQRDMRFVGTGTDDNEYTFDGIDATGVQEQNQKVGVRLAMPLGAIAEFRGSTSVYAADKGGAPGGQFSVVSNSGTNQFHGSAFEFLRNSAFDARGPFDVTLPPFRMNQFGVNVGGPIKKNRTFFFLDYEGIRQVLDTTIIGFVPSAAFRATVTNPALTPLLSSWPVGTVPTSDPTVDEWISTGPNNQREDVGFARVDHTFSPRTSIFARMTIDDATIREPMDNVGGYDEPLIRPSNYVAQLTHVFSPTIVNELRGGINRSAMHHWFYGTCPSSTPFNGEPGTVCPQVAPFSGTSTNDLDEEVGTTVDGYDDLTLVKGRHSIKLGLGVERHRLNNSDESIAQGNVTYASSQDFVNNALADYNFVGQLTLGGERRTVIMSYAEDTWKARPNLTLNLGLRWEHYTVLKEAFGRQAIVTVACGGFCPKGTLLYFPYYKDFAPRTGIAWLPGGANGKTVIRTGFGMFFAPNQMDDFTDGHESTGQRFDVTSAIVPNLTWPVLTSELPAPFYSPKAWQQDRRDGYQEEWDFAVQRMLPGRFTGQIAYVGLAGHRLFGKIDANVLNPLTGKAPLPNFGIYGWKNNIGNSNFNSLQVSVQRNFTRGWLWGTQYMWSHGMAGEGFGGGDTTSVQNVFCIECDYSSSPIDIRHSLSVDSVYELPFGPGQRFLNSHSVAGEIFGGWQLSGIATAESGQPLDITINLDPSVVPDGDANYTRPDLVPGVPIYPAHQTINSWLNPAAFAAPAPGTWGNLGRNVARGPGYYEIDTALQRKVTISERLALDFRAEAFNLFNHPIYGLPDTDVSDGSGAFGVVTSELNIGAIGIGASRRIQFMLRLEF